MTVHDSTYLMENSEEATRLEVKTDPAAVREQAVWCGVQPGMRVLDAGCGPGITTAILHEMLQPNGEIIGMDYSEERIRYARQQYLANGNIDFRLHDLRNPLSDVEPFDLIWVRFVLEYNRRESLAIVRNLIDCLKPGGWVCLMDLDYNCLSHYQLPQGMEDILFRLMERLENSHNFDPYAGRKLYSYLFDLGLEDIRLHLLAHHLMYGKIRSEDVFNWVKKVEVGTRKAADIFEEYPQGREGFFKDFNEFFLHPRRFTYTPLILSRGRKPLR